MRVPRVPLLAMAALGLATVLALHARRSAGDSLAQRMAQIRQPTGGTEVSCRDLAARRPLVLLALGQSNAGNHGEISAPNGESVFVITEGKCIETTDPLPGATGSGGSIWARLPRFLREQGLGTRPVAMAILAVDASTIGEWTNAQSPLAALLVSRITTMKQLALPPDAILWQQGESDARKGTGRDEYTEGLKKLAGLLDRAGTGAPVLLAQSTLCQGPPNDTIRQAIQLAPTWDRRFRAGPDTDFLTGETNRIGCHMTAAGLESAARMWASAVAKEIILPESRELLGNSPPYPPGKDR